MAHEAFEFLIPGELQAATGGYVYDRRILAELRALGWRAAVRALHASFPTPSTAALEHADGVLADIPAGRPVLIDGMAFSAMPEVLRAHGARLPLVALLHMPLGATPFVDSEHLARLREIESGALRSAKHVIVTGRGSLATLRGYGLPPEQVTLIEPGTDIAELVRRRSAGPIRLLCVATVHPLKGHELLVEALAPLASLPWQLTCVGSLTQSPETVAHLRARLDQLGLTDRVALLGEVPHAALSPLYRRSDLFVLATRFESYCMAAAEALAHGLPVVSTQTGAMPELVGTRAGRLVPVGDQSLLRAALAAALGDPTLLATWTEGAAAVRLRLPQWPDAAARFAAVLRAVRTS
ncbi:MAG TPA: glycosyltransferase family 4 protein [Steroidobacteraceae bacterium]|jgi:glycosyltransferase involved in cell wall biosynthesis|nr:glycosyltransferase family 4 protein [Steroidobacteraceae bacterium]